MKLRLTLLSSALIGLCSFSALAVQGYYRSGALHNDDVIFTAEGDLWLACAKAPAATRLTSHLAEETQPVISPDGRQLAFVANYDGAAEIYLMPVSGGVAKRVVLKTAELVFSSGSTMAVFFSLPIVLLARPITGCLKR